MEKAIILNFPPKIPREVRNQLIESVNDKLSIISVDVNSWNGFIDVIKSSHNEFSYVAKCDNEAIRSKMQGLLDTI
ncbi:MAG: hypothetical protein ABI402_16290 [Ferruginibacter sp.]